MKRRFSVTLFVLLLAAALLFTGCAKKEAAQPAAPVAAAPAPVEVAKPALDKDAVLMAAATEYFEQLANGNNIMQAAAVKQMLDDNPDAVVVVDIRRAADFEEGHIPGAFHSEWADLGKVMEKIPTNRQVVVACYSGQTAGQAVGALRLAGFNNVVSLAAGMSSWTAETETGMRAMASRNNVSSPKGEEQEILWEAAKANFVSVGKDGNKMIQSQALYDALDTNPRAFKVLDIRGKSDWEAGHVMGSTQVDWAKFGTVLPSLDKKDKIVIVCFSGQTAGQTVGVLRSMGFDAYSLAGGMNNGWKPAGLPMET